MSQLVITKALAKAGTATFRPRFRADSRLRGQAGTCRAGGANAKNAMLVGGLYISLEPDEQDPLRVWVIEWPTSLSRASKVPPRTRNQRIRSTF